MKRSLVIMLVVIVCVLGIAFGLLRNLALHGMQIHNLEVGRRHLEALEAYRAREGRYPEGLAAVFAQVRIRQGRAGFDQWERPFYYEARDGGFVLVSCGRDGRRDPLDYWAVREEFGRTGRIRKICGDWDADQVFTEKGMARVCGK